ncbi:ATP-binding protein [Sulfitobacter sp. CW3]|uniref:ATP-binding protein n=1 Tax=Sulfitobacter sp. CW3 TaxID=2861965 RepID=UPI001C5D001D|nr:ATP-binding protein [Sulfitobacter sp. CW3]MBW4960425.1 response regulator [Sulfitobacter sp. CW3]
MRLRSFSTGIRREIWRAISGPMLGLLVAACLIPSMIYFSIAEARLKERVDNLANATLATMQDHIWQYDLEDAQQLLDSYVEIGAVTGARVSDGKFIDLTAGTPGDYVTGYSLELPLYGGGQSSDVEIGTLRLEASKSGIWEFILVRIIATIVTSAVFVFFTAFLALRLLDRTLLQPVLTISDTLKEHSGDLGSLNIDLDDGPAPRPRDELTGLVDAIHGMRDQILSSQAVLNASMSKLTHVARFARLGYATLDSTLDRFVDCDPAFASSFNMSVQEVLDVDVRGEFLGRFLRDENPDRLNSIRARLHKGQMSEGVLKFTLNNDEIRYFRHIIRPFIDKVMGHSALEIIILDVTEQKIVEEQLLQAQKLDAIGMLTGGVAHDFNNLLAIISGNIELTLLSLESPQERAFLEVALSAVGSGATLTQQLLSFARKQPLSPTHFDAAELMRDSSALFDTSVGEAIDLEIVADDDLWRTFADPEKLKTTLLNLVVNSRDAMPDGGLLTIEISNCRLSEEYAASHVDVSPGEYVRISVNDTGYGMSQETIQHAIEPFFTTKGVGKGTGLGLPMAFGFAKQSDGHLEVYSELGIGTSVKLYLPRSTEEDVPPVNRNRGKQRPDFTGMVVLLIEDNTDLRAMFKTMLVSMGCVVRDAEDGPKALKMAETISQVDVILSDVILPRGMNGNEVVNRLTPLFPEAAVIFMSGFSENSIIHNGRLDPEVTLLQKPFGGDELVAAIISAHVFPLKPRK